MNNPNSINCGNLRFSDKELCELDGKQILISVPKKDIILITIEFGHAVERPITELSIGLVLCTLGVLFGLLPLRAYFLDPVPLREPLYAFKLFAYALPLVGLGMYFIIPLFRKSYYLNVCTMSDKRKIGLKDCEPHTVINISQQLGYPINANSGPNKFIQPDRE